MIRTIAYVLVILPCLSLQATAAEPVKRTTLTIYAQPITKAASANRLLPTAPQLRDGNAVIELLRLPWEQNNYMLKTEPKLGEMLAQRPFDDPNLAADIHFDGFAERLRRAAYTRDANWDYNTQEGALAEVLLPDMQGLRVFVGYGMSLWINTKIASGELEEAREGIAVQLACARHIAKAPFLINRLVAEAIAQESLNRVELLMQQEEAPNLYWPLALLPDTIGDDAVCWQWEAEMLIGSVPSLGRPLPPIGDRRWRDAAKEILAIEMLLSSEKMKPDYSSAEDSELRRLLETDLREQGDSEQDIANMRDEELAIRRLIWLHESINAQIEAAFGLPGPQALKQLEELEKKMASGQTTGKDVDPGEASILTSPVRMFYKLRQFDRRRRMLQTVEAIRDYAGDHQGQLPATLSELRLPAPHDPLTGEPFEYERNESKAILRMAPINDKIDRRDGLVELELVVR